MRGCRPLDSNEIEQGLDQLQGSRLKMRNRCLFLLGLYSGFRISELLSLRVGDVVRNGQVLQRVQVQRRNMKGKRSSREVPLNVHARWALAAWLPLLFRWRGAQSDTFVFQSLQGGPITRRQASRIMLHLAETLDWAPRIGTHSLRKTFAREVYTRACAAWRPGQELPVRIVMKALGHRSVDVTEAYLSLDVAMVDHAVLSLDFGDKR